MSAAPKWTPEEDVELERMVAEGLPFVRIAELTGRTVGAVSGRASRRKFRTTKERGSWARKSDSEGRPAAKRKKPGTEVKSNVPTQGGRSPSKRTQYYRAADMLPFILTKESTLLHVYDRDPYAREPLVTYEKRGNHWVSRVDPTSKFTSVAAAVGAVHP